ncbi:MAG: GGDEF domain-containing protein [Rhodocyclaceae bacterium]|nr:GGDEF domain-containing protein [Rhodocyclaceae bacterium]
MNPSSMAKAGLVLAAALLLLAGGLFAAGASRDDSGLEQRYVRSLELAARAVEAQRTAARMYEQLARATARSAEAGSGEALAEELRGLTDSLRELSGKLSALRDGEPADAPSDEGARAGQAAARLAAVAAELQRLGSAADPATLRRRLIAVGETDLRQIDALLGSVLAVQRAQIDDSAQQARQTGRLARVSVFAAGALALALGVTLTLVAWRWLTANAALMEQLTQLAREDSLTGVANRRTLDERLPQEMARATRQKYALSVVMIDLDHFKRFNDRRGHAAGDALLRNAAQAWLRQLRPSDLLARYGGEEFTLVLPACDEEQAEHMVERLQPLVPEKQTFSAGIATWNGMDDAQALLAAADRALLQAKRGGRNRIVISGREPQISLPLRLVS